MCLINDHIVSKILQNGIGSIINMYFCYIAYRLIIGISAIIFARILKPKKGEQKWLIKSQKCCYYWRWCLKYDIWFYD